jgi:SAM-dependent methyltransferase
MSYDALPYPSLPLAQTHPERMATQATLLGLSPVPVERCRVLELGCASGGNLLPMATLLPESRFVGIDLSPRQIDAGRAIVDELEVKNLELRALDIAALAADEAMGAELGQFDYIIAHGVYAWVPKPVQEALLAVCRRHLSPQGVAYVSYNTYPGFYKRQPIRDMMMFHDANRRAKHPQLELLQSARGARQLLDFMETAVPEGNGIWGNILKEEASKLRMLPDGYLCHEHLEPNNAPLYFHEFASAAGRHGLKFLTEAGRLCTWDDCTPGLRRIIEAEIGKIDEAGDPDIVRLEQYLDFVRNQSLRRTLLVHDQLVIDRRLPPSRVRPLWASCAAWPPPADQVLEADVRQPRELLFRSRLGSVKVVHPVFKCVLIALSNEEPRAQRFTEIVDNAGELLGAPIDEAAVAEILMEACRTGLTNLHVHPPHFTLAVSERPLVSPLARLQARHQLVVANLLHEGVKIEPIERLILPLLDGKHDIASLLPPLVRAARDGILVVQRDQKPERDEAVLREILAERIPAALDSIAGSALLLA